MPKQLYYGATIGYNGTTPWNGTFSGTPTLTSACWSTFPEVGFESQEVESTDSCSPGAAIERIAGLSDGKQFTMESNWPGATDAAWGFGAGSLLTLADAKATIAFQATFAQFAVTTKIKWDAVLLGWSFQGGAVGDIVKVMITARITGPIDKSNS
jgi:hypothetical protein